MANVGYGLNEAPIPSDLLAAYLGDPEQRRQSAIAQALMMGGLGILGAPDARTGLAQGGMMALQTYGQANKGAEEQAMKRLQLEEALTKAARDRTSFQQEQQANKAIGTTSLAGLDYNATMAAIDQLMATDNPKQIEKAMKLREDQLKKYPDAREIEVVLPNGRPGKQLVSARTGDPVSKPWPTAVKGEAVDNGQTNQLRDPFTGDLMGGSVQKQMTPSEVASDEVARGNLAVARDNLGIRKQQLVLEQRKAELDAWAKANGGEVKEDAEGNWIIVNQHSGMARPVYMQPQGGAAAPSIPTPTDGTAEAYSKPRAPQGSPERATEEAVLAAKGPVAYQMRDGKPVQVATPAPQELERAGAPSKDKPPNEFSKHMTGLNLFRDATANYRKVLAEVGPGVINNPLSEGAKRLKNAYADLEIATRMNIGTGANLSNREIEEIQSLNPEAGTFIQLVKNKTIDRILQENEAKIPAKQQAYEEGFGFNRDGKKLRMPNATVLANVQQGAAQGATPEQLKEWLIREGYRWTPSAETAMREQRKRMKGGK